MIFVQLFFTFLKIGIFTFGGGYAMVALIQNEVVARNAWLTSQEFTDILAVSQMTPGPIGINTATYTGYTAVLNAGYDPSMAVCGALLASFAVVLLPVLLMLLVSRFLIRHGGNKDIESVFSVLRKVVVGVIAAAAIMLLDESSFGHPGVNLQFVVSVLIFVVVFVMGVMPKEKMHIPKPSPITLLLLSGLVGLLVYM